MKNILDFNPQITAPRAIAGKRSNRPAEKSRYRHLKIQQNSTTHMRDDNIYTGSALLCYRNLNIFRQSPDFSCHIYV